MNPNMTATDYDVLAGEVRRLAHQLWVDLNYETYAYDAAHILADEKGIISIAAGNPDDHATIVAVLRECTCFPSGDEDYDEPFEPGDICTTEDGRLTICTTDGSWTVTQDQALRLIRGLSSLMIRTNEQEAPHV